MRFQRVSSVAAVVSVAWLTAIGASAQDFNPGEVLVVCVEGVPSSLCEEAITTIGAQVIERHEAVGVFLATTASGLDEFQTISLLELDSRIEGASVNYLYESGGHLTIPDDTNFGQQWGLDNTGRNLVGVGGLLGNPVGIIDADIDAPQAWEHGTSCANEVVAVIDSGVDITHADFVGNAPAGNIFVNPADNTVDATDNDGNGVVDDVNGANFAAYETYVDNVTVNQLYDAGEPIYVDTDSNRVVTAGEVAVTGPAAANGTALRNFISQERHAENVNANGIYDNGESIYFENAPINMMVDAGDVLVAGPAQPNGTALINFVRIPNNNVTDVTGHGTNVASVIGAFGNNTMGIAGICWRVQLLAVKVARPPAPGSFFVNDFIAGLNYVVALNGAGVNVRVVNLSAGRHGPRSAPENAAITAAANAGMLFVAAAGNESVNTDSGVNETHADNVTANGIFDAGEAIYVDGDASGTVSGAEAPIQGPAQAAGTVLRLFANNELHADNINANTTFDAGEAIYRDNDSSGTVSAGDTLVQGPAQANGTALLPFRYDTVFPCNYVPAPDNILCVAASDNRDRLATAFSNFGTTSVDLAAPGQDIRMLQNGGGTTLASGTSFAAPMVSGIAAHFWSRTGFTTHTMAQVRTRLLTGTNGPVGVAHPDGVDPRPGLLGRVVSGPNNDGRGRMVMGDDFGDAPDVPYPTRLSNNGARHEDVGEEWLGQPAVSSDVSPEFEASNGGGYPPDPDGLSNLVDRDDHDDGIVLRGPFVFSPAAGGPIRATVDVYIDTENNMMMDAEGGRYGGAHIGGDGVHGATDDKFVWVNGFFDWNIDGDWDDANEHVFSLRADPSMWPGSDGHYTVVFNMPMKPALVNPGTRYARFRLDYGENAGRAKVAPPNAVGPSPAGLVKFWDDAGGLPEAGPAAQRYGSVTGAQALNLTRGVAQFGEVEDYEVHGEGALAVELVSFEAILEGSSVRLVWETASEIDNVGFRVLRSSGSQRFAPVSDLILARGGPSSGASYEFLDESVGPEETYHYLLEDIDAFGRSTLHGTGGCTYEGDSRRCPPLVITTSALSAADFCASHPIRAARRARRADEDACRSADWGANEPGRRNPQDCRVRRGGRGTGPVCVVGPNAD